MPKAKVIIVMTAYNVAPVLPKAVASIPVASYDEIIVVDDCSRDNTAEVARKLGVTVIVHAKNTGYGGAQKTGYKEALKRGADIVVLVHGDNQYDPSYVPAFISKIKDEGCDVVTGTRMVMGDVLKNGMPIWKFIPNRCLTGLENLTFGSNITDYHNGFRAYSGRLLAQIPLDLFSNKFDFDTYLIIHGAMRKYKIGEVPHPTRYMKENSQMPFSKGVDYGLTILRIVFLFTLHRSGIYKQKVFALDAKNAG